MPSINIGNLTEFQPGTLKEIEVEGKTLAIANLGGKLYAVEGVCGHAGGRLGRGKLTGETIKCPRHGAEYDVRTGKNVKKPFLPLAKASDVKTYVVRIEGDSVLLDL